MNKLRFLEIATQIMQTTFTTPRLSLSLVTEEDHAFIKALLNTKAGLNSLATVIFTVKKMPETTSGKFCPHLIFRTGWCDKSQIKHPLASSPF